tara:strand:- start:443 stop:724 length:282 start_codon:yes stop_codon:yes gene_type:complete
MRFHKKKTKQKSNKHLRLFNKYSKTSKKKDNLTGTQIKKLMKNEFKLVYSTHVFNSFISIWSSNVNGKQVITKDTFVNKLFRGPDGFFRDIYL